MNTEINAFFVKNMVCPRCIMAVKEVLQEHGIEYSDVQLGAVYLQHPIDKTTYETMFADLIAIGFERVEDADRKIIEKIKHLIINTLRDLEDKQVRHQKWSDIISGAVHKDYSHLSKLFSDLEGMTIEHYIILQRVERIKELLLYDELTISEMAHLLGYSSSQFLSTQFKQHTGLTPTEFKRNHRGLRKALDRL